MFEDQYVTCDYVCFIIRVFLDLVWATWYLNKITGQKKLFVVLLFIFLSFFHNFIYSSIFGCAESSLLKGLLLSCGAQASGRGGFSLWSRGSWPSRLRWSGGMGFRAPAPELLMHRLTAPWPVGSSRTRVQTHVSCTGRRVLYHRDTREVPRRSVLLNAVHVWKLFVVEVSKK